MASTFRTNAEQCGKPRKLHLCAAAAVLLAMYAPALTRADEKLCANYNYSAAPTIDGVIAGDNGWRYSNMYVFNNGVDTPHARLEMTRDSNALYFALEINNDPTFDREDIIILTLAPTSAASTHRRIHIFPVAENVGNQLSAPGGPPVEVKYWTNSSMWLNAPNQTPPTWLTRSSGGGCRNICVTSSSSALAMKSYFVEIKVPISTNPDQGVELPNTGDFGLYFNIIRAKPGASPGSKEGLDELRWPSTAPAISANPALRITRVETNTPLVATWGQSSLQGPCSGISMNRAYTNNASPSAINYNSTNNIFSVELINTGTADGVGVTAQLKAARFGLPGMNDYQPYPAPSTWRNPIGPSGVIAANGGTVTLQTPPWDILNDPNRASYVGRTDACSIIELSTTPPSGSPPPVATTLISNRFGSLNMHFGNASKFEHTAVLGTNGYEMPADGSNLQRFQLLVSKETDAEIFGKPEVTHADPRRRAFSHDMKGTYLEKRTRFLRKTVCGYRETGREVIVEGTTLRMLESANCYGYLIGHDGPLAEWEDQIIAKGGGKLEAARGNPNLFYAAVEHGRSMELSTSVEAREQPRGPCTCGDWRCVMGSPR
ncbi:MAG TPA: hypothetical protein VI078_14965 [bacterium]